MRRAGPGPAVALALLYAGVAAATHALVPEAGRPLFDGFAPPPPYHYVSPPGELASSNLPPRPARTAVTLGEAGSEAINVSTPDAQAIVTLPAGAVGPNPPDTSAAVELTPLAPATLGPLPPDLRSIGNAYQLAMAYQPSGTAVTAIAPSATVALTGATQGDTLLHSTDGQAWQTVAAARPFGDTHGMTGPAQGPGYYLVAASPAIRPEAPFRDDEGGGVVGAIVPALVTGGLVGGGALVWRRIAREEHARRARERRRQDQRRKPRRRR